MQPSSIDRRCELFIVLILSNMAKIRVVSSTKDADLARGRGYRPDAGGLAEEKDPDLRCIRGDSCHRPFWPFRPGYECSRVRECIRELLCSHRRSALTRRSALADRRHSLRNLAPFPDLVNRLQHPGPTIDLSAVTNHDRAVKFRTYLGNKWPRDVKSDLVP